MLMVTDLAKDLKGFLRLTSLSEFAQLMVMRLVLAFIMHRGRMSCSQAAGAIRSEPIHRSQLTRFLARPRWQTDDFNTRLRLTLLEMEPQKGRYIFIIDATLCGQSGKKAQNTYSTGNRVRRPKKGRRYGKQKHAPRSCHSFTLPAAAQSVRLRNCRRPRPRTAQHRLAPAEVPAADRVHRERPGHPAVGRGGPGEVLRTLTCPSRIRYSPGPAPNGNSATETIHARL